MEAQWNWKGIIVNTVSSEGIIGYVCSNTYLRTVTIDRKFNTNRNLKNWKYVPTPPPKCPSISFIDSYHNSLFMIALWMICFVLILKIPILWIARFHRFMPIWRLLFLTVNSTLDLICLLMLNDCGNARSVALKKRIRNSWFVIRQCVCRHWLTFWVVHQSDYPPASNCVARSLVQNGRGRDHSLHLLKIVRQVTTPSELVKINNKYFYDASSFQRTCRVSTYAFAI